MARPTAACDGRAVFFRGEYVIRTLNGTLAVISGLAPGALAAAIAFYISTTTADMLSHVVSAIFALVALVFASAGLWALGSWVCDRRTRVGVNEDGLFAGNRFWPWGEVRAISGIRYRNGTCLRFTPRRKFLWSDGTLPTTPLLTDQQYIELARELGQCLLVRFPHLLVGTAPEDPTAGP